MLFLVLFIAFRTAAGVNIILLKASSITGGVQVGCRPSAVIPTKPKKNLVRWLCRSHQYVVYC